MVRVTPRRNCVGSCEPGTSRRGPFRALIQGVGQPVALRSLDPLCGGEHSPTDELPDRHALPLGRLLNQAPLGGINPGGDQRLPLPVL